MAHTIEFVIYPESLSLDITGPLEVFNAASALLHHRQGTHTGYDIRCVGLDTQPVGLSGGLSLQPAAVLDEETPCDTLIIPGQFGSLSAMADPTLIERIKKKAGKANRIVSICSGAFILAEAGILDHRRATTHWMFVNRLARQYPKIKVVKDAIFVQDGPVHTSGGVTAGIDLALTLVEDDFGTSLAIEVSRYLLVYFRRPGAQSQFSTPLKLQAAAGRRFADLHSWLLNHIGESITVEKMAEVAAMSLRNFSRVFKKATGKTPTHYLETIRLDRAREILATSNENLDHIASLCGFRREDRLRKAFIRRFKMTPSQYRLHFHGDRQLPGV